VEAARDLIDAVRAARRGLRRDVQQLIESLPRGALFIPLARPMGVPLDRPAVTRESMPVATHLMSDPQGRKAFGLFTRPEFLSKAGGVFGWTTEGKPLQYCGMRGNDAFALALSSIERDGMPLVIDAFQPWALELSADEARAIAKGEAVPLVGYAAQTPVQAGETFMTGQPATPPPPELVRSLKAFVAAHAAVAGYDLVQVFNPERDLAPHLLLNLRTKGRGADPEALVRDVQEAVREKVPPPGYLDIVFDQSF
jgi:hypothetical protein